MLTKHEKPNLHVIGLTCGQLRVNVMTQVVSLNCCGLFCAILVARIKQLNYCKIVQENLNFVG